MAVSVFMRTIRDYKVLSGRAGLRVAEGQQRQQKPVADVVDVRERHHVVT